MKQLILALLVVSLFASAAYAQEISFGSPAVQTVKIQINENGVAHVTHVVEKSKDAQQLTVIRSDFTNLKITTEGGSSPEYGEIGGNLPGFLIFPNDEKVLVEYDLESAITKTGNLWQWDYYYLASTTFYLPESVKIVYANSNPVLLQDVDGVRCHGCLLLLEYDLQHQEKVQQIKWEDKAFDVKIFATGEISDLRFDQPNKLISLDVTEKDQYVTLIIPKELLWNPYEVFLNEKKILKHEFYETEETAWINFKPNETGTVEVIGVSAVPEFPLVAAILMLGMSAIIAARLSDRINLR